VHPLAETALGPEIVVEVEFEYDTDVFVSATFGILADRESSAIRAFSAEVHKPWMRAITARDIQQLVGVARNEAARELAERSQAEFDDDSLNSVALKTPTKPIRVYTDDDYLRFAVTIDAVMQRPAGDFRNSPSRPYGRLAGTEWSRLSRRGIDHWLRKARELGLLEDDDRLTPKARGRVG
jgi:hypothetical protein